MSAPFPASHRTPKRSAPSHVSLPANIPLCRARLFGSAKSEVGSEKYPWESPAVDLAAAEKLINECGYHRRDEELADAKEAAKSW